MLTIILRATGQLTLISVRPYFLRCTMGLFTPPCGMQAPQFRVNEVIHPWMPLSRTNLHPYNILAAPMEYLGKQTKVYYCVLCTMRQKIFQKNFNSFEQKYAVSALLGWCVYCTLWTFPAIYAQFDINSCRLTSLSLALDLYIAACTHL